MHFIRWLVIGILAVSGLNRAHGDGPVGTDVPVAPIAATRFEGWTNTFLLRNGAMEVVVAPCIGRIAAIRFRGGDNLLRLDPGLYGRVPPTNNTERWTNYGGDWFWPVAQSRWTSMTNASWPPPISLADQPWAGTAWKDADGSQCCTLTREYGEPVHIKVTRLIKLDPDAARLSIRQRIERVAESAIPVVLWNVSQIGGARRVILPVDSESIFERGLRPLLFGTPGDDQLVRCEGAAVYDAASGEHKLCSDSRRAWIAALKDDTLIVERATNNHPDGKHPDGGCTVEMYSNSGLGYAEIETLSVEKTLQPGESLQNTLTIECAAAATNAAPCELAAQVRGLLGESSDQ